MTQVLRDNLAPNPNPRLSYAEFLGLDDENQHLEWVDGEVIPMAAVSNEHDTIRLFIAALIRGFAEETGCGEVRSEPFQMKTGPALPGRSPDVLFVATAHLARIERLYVDGPADVVVEIISPESRARDRGEKFYEYEQGGVSEYWLIDPPRKQAEFYLRGADGIYQLARRDEKGEFQSQVLKGFRLNPDILWQRPLLTVRAMLNSWGI